MDDPRHRIDDPLAQLAAPSAAHGLQATLLRTAAGALTLDALALVAPSGDAVACEAAWPGSWRPPAAMSLRDGVLFDAVAAGSVVTGALSAQQQSAIAVATVPGDREDEASRLLVGVCAGPRAFTEPELALFGRFAELAEWAALLEAEVRSARDAQARTAGMVDAGMALAAELDLEQLLERLVASARQVLGARYAALGVLDPTRTGLERFITSGITPAQRAEIGEPPRGRGVLGALIRDARPLRLDRLADDPRSAGFPEGHPPMRSFLGVPVTMRGEVFGNLYVTEKVGGAFTEEDEQLAQVLAAQAAVAIDNARRYQSERARVHELERVHEMAATAQEVGRGLLDALDLPRLLSLVARRLRRLVGADTAAVAVRGPGGLVVRHAHGVQALMVEGLPAQPGLPGLQAALGAALPAATVRVTALADGGEVLGALVAVGVPAFDEMTAPLMDALAGQAVVALRLAQRQDDQIARLRAAADERVAEARARADVESQRRALAAQEAERARLARELHDETGQLLTAVRMHLTQLSDHLADDDGRRSLESLRSLVGDAAENVRRLLTELRPGSVRERGVAAAIARSAQRLAEDGGVPCDVDVEQLPDGLPDEVQVALYRVVQEALTNIARHAGARSASVLATAHGGRLRLVIEDDGSGFEPDAPTTRLGLSGIRERVELLGGSLRIDSSPGSGTAVIVDLAVPA